MSSCEAGFGIDSQSGVQNWLSRQRCEFSLIRYVPDPVKNEFVNIGVLLEERGRAGGGALYARLEPGTLRGSRCRYDDAGGAGGGDWAGGWPGMHERVWRRSRMRFRMRCRLTEAKACLAESFATELEEIDAAVCADGEAASARAGARDAAALQARMRTEFERAGVWESDAAAHQCGAVHAGGRSAAHRLRIPSEWRGADVSGGVAGGRCGRREGVGVFCGGFAGGRGAGGERDAGVDGDC